MQYLRDNVGVLESSANGTDWTPVFGPAEELSNPVTIGAILVRENNNTIEMSLDAGTTWLPVYVVGQTELLNNYFVPPTITQGTEPTAAHPALENEGSIAVWRDNVLSQTWLVCQENNVIKKVELT